MDYLSFSNGLIVEYEPSNEFIVGDLFDYKITEAFVHYPNETRESSGRKDLIFKRVKNFHYNQKDVVASWEE